MYQAWQQGNEHYERDWSYFVEDASQKIGVSGDKIMQVLQKCIWFHYPEE
jgi:hypothetical protein